MVPERGNKLGQSTVGKLALADQQIGGGQGALLRRVRQGGADTHFAEAAVVQDVPNSPLTKSALDTSGLV